MDWYYILFVVVFTIFIIKNIISWVAGEVDVDFDLDENIDYDISTMFSFNGIIHFVLGFSSYLSINGYFFPFSKRILGFTRIQSKNLIAPSPSYS